LLRQPRARPSMKDEWSPERRMFVFRGNLNQLLFSQIETIWKIRNGGTVDQQH
jgi:hypothetical protein